MDLLGDRVLELGPRPEPGSPYRHFKLTRDADGIAWLLFDREGASANTLSADLIEELETVLAALESAAPDRASSFARQNHPVSSPAPTSTNSAAPPIRGRSRSRSAAPMR